MNKSFNMIDKINNSSKKADVIVKFSFGDKDYLIYSVAENEQNSQILTSRIIVNSEGKYFLDNISPEEKNKISNIVYNIVILIPTEMQKGNSFDALIGNLKDKFSVSLSMVNNDLDDQEYYSNSSIAITNKLLVESAIKVYSDNLISSDESENILVPTWTAPSEVVIPTEVRNQDISEVNTGNNIKTDAITSVDMVSQSEPLVGGLESNVVTNNISNAENLSDNVAISNPQVQKLAIVSDPSLSVAGVSVRQPNVGKLKKAGFANTKYVVIGTICLILAIAVVITAYVLIKNMS